MLLNKNIKNIEKLRFYFDDRTNYILGHISKPSNNLYLKSWEFDSILTDLKIPIPTTDYAYSSEIIYTRVIQHFFQFQKKRDKNFIFQIAIDSNDENVFYAKLLLKKNYSTYFLKNYMKPLLKYILICEEIYDFIHIPHYHSLLQHQYYYDKYHINKYQIEYDLYTISHNIKTYNIVIYKIEYLLNYNNTKYLVRRYLLDPNIKINQKQSNYNKYNFFEIYPNIYSLFD